MGSMRYQYRGAVRSVLTWINGAPCADKTLRTLWARRPGYHHVTKSLRAYRYGPQQIAVQIITLQTISRYMIALLRRSGFAIASAVPVASFFNMRLHSGSA